MVRAKTPSIPGVGTEAPEFHLPSAQGGQLRLSMRTAVGPVVVVFYSGGWSAEDVAYFKDLATKEDEINHAGASIVGIGVGGPVGARDFVRETGIKSYVLYDYASIAAREYGLLEKDKEHGEYARPATFIVSPEHEVLHAWVGERPEAEEILAKVSEITGLPKRAEEETEGEAKPKKSKTAGAEAGERRKPSPEGREKRRAAREKGQKKPAAAQKKAGEDAETEARDAPESGRTPRAGVEDEPGAETKGARAVDREAGTEAVEAKPASKTDSKPAEGG